MEKYLPMDRIYEGMNRFQQRTCGRILALCACSGSRVRRICEFVEESVMGFWQESKGGLMNYFYGYLVKERTWDFTVLKGK